MSEVNTISTLQASTGPRPRGRGMKINYWNSLSESVLQRGRARAGAECTSMVSPSLAVRGFNGAAPARARNDSR